MEYVGEETLVEENDPEGGWVETHHFADDGSGSKPSIVMEMEGSKVDEELSADMDAHNLDDDDKADDDNGDEEEAAIDMDDFEESGLLDQVDPSTATIDPKKVEAKKSNQEESDVDAVVHTRTYDLHITYDKYYQTPRLWVIGYDENRKPLTVEQMYEDVSQDHAKKTVTMESHPHLPGPNMASVHPCK